MEAVAGSIINIFVSVLVDTVERQLSYIYGHKSIFDKFRFQESNLRNARYRLRLSDYETKKRSEMLDDFNQIIIRAHELLERMTEEQVGQSASLRSRYRLGWKAMHMTKDIETLLRHAERDLNSQYASASTNSSGMLATKELIDALYDDEIITIGVFGENSTRIKSELIKVCEIVNEEDVFCDLAIVVVSQGEGYLSKIQYDLAEMLGFTFNQTADFSERASLLLERISGRDKMLIILDNVSQKFGLESVGIPCKNADHYSSYKVLITSQEELVCLEMGAQETFHVEDFSDVGWGVFTEKTGKWVHKAGMHSIAKSLVHKCGDKLTEVEKLAKDVEAWIEKTEGPIRPQLQTTSNEHRVGIIYEAVGSGPIETVFELLKRRYNRNNAPHSIS